MGGCGIDTRSGTGTSTGIITASENPAKRVRTRAAEATKLVAKFLFSMKNRSESRTCGLAETMHVDEQQEPQVRARLAELRLEHRDLDDAIHRLTEGVYVDQLQLRRMKKRKLLLKDVISQLESMLIPDLDA